MTAPEPRSSGGAPPTSWRKRHPVLARTLLYGAGCALATLVLLLLLQRKEVDRADRAAYYAARLDTIEGVLFPQDPIGDVTLEALAQDLAAPDVPSALRARVLRLEGLVHARAKRPGEAEAAFAKAEALTTEARDRGALLVEWAEARASAGDAAGAQALLARPGIPDDGALGLLAAMARGFAEEQAGRREEAARLVDAALVALSAPLPPGPEDRVSTRLWTPAAAALEATVYLGRVQVPPDPGPWRRLARLAPREVPALVVAAEALVQQGLASEALALLEAARRVDPTELEGQLSRRPALRELGAAGTPAAK